MRELEKGMVCIVLNLFVAGCVGTARTVEIPDAAGIKRPTVQEENMSGEVGVSKTRSVLHGTVSVPASDVSGEELNVAAITEDPAVHYQAKITYSQIINLIGEFLEIEATAQGPSGEPVFLGTSENKLVALEIIGHKDNVSRASMKFFYPKDISTVNADLNKAMLLRFLRNTVSEFEDWPARVTSILRKFQSIQIGMEEEEIISDGKMIHILYDKNTGSLTVTVSLI